MIDERWSMDQIERACGIPKFALESRRRASHVAWHQKGYTIDEVFAILKGIKLSFVGLPDLGKSQKARRLRVLLLATKED